MPFSRPVRFLFRCLWMFVLLSLAPIHTSAAQDSKPKFRVVALAEHGGIHQPFVDAAKIWLQKLAADSNFSIDYIENTKKIDDAFLSHYQLFIHLDYPPYAWTPTAMTAFVKYIEEGRGGWIGFHHATLLGEFDGYKMWPWFSQFMGDIRFTSYIPKFATATVIVENKSHPTMKNLGDSFRVKDEEWYTYNKSPRPNVHVLARVDEGTYSPDTSTKRGTIPWSGQTNTTRLEISIFSWGVAPSIFKIRFHNSFSQCNLMGGAPMKKYFPILLLSLTVLFSPNAALAQQPRFKVLAFYSTSVEPDHVLFAEGALKFFSEVAQKNNFTFDSTTHWDDMNDSNIGKYQMIVWLNDEPSKAEQKRAFQKYIENGGAWLGFHVAAYNDKDSKWPWFVDFLGGGVFHINSWPPLPAKLTVDDRSHPVTMHLPESFTSPDNEWYIWKPSPRLNKDVRVLVTLDPSNYPIGFKDVLTSGDLPVVWTNTKYKMLYMNMGHGDKIFASPIQNKLIEDGALWLGTISTQAEMPVATGTEISPHAVVVNPKTKKVYAVNSSNGTVTVMDSPANSTTTAKVGSEPVAIAVNAVTNRIYVGNSGSGTISVIDGTTDAVTATVKVGALPYVVAANPTTNKIYVSKTFSNTMTVIDGRTNATSDLKPGIQADAIAVNPVTNKLYLTNYESQNVTVMDGTTHDTTSVVAGVHLWAIALNPVTNKIYLANAGSSNLTVIDGASNAVTTVKTGEIPCAVAVDSVANRVYAVNYASDSVTVIDGANNAVIATVGVGARPQAIGINSVTHTIYVANTHSNNVTMVDGTNNSVIATVVTGKGPYAIAVDPAANKAYVSNMEKNSLTVIDRRQATPGGRVADEEQQKRRTEDEKSRGSFTGNRE